MKIEIDESGLPTFWVFNTIEEWNNHPMSFVGWEDRGRYGDRFMNEPVLFPCICLEGPYIYKRDGPDLHANQFIYDFKIIDR